VSCGSAEAFQTGGNKWLSMTDSEEEFILKIFRTQSFQKLTMDGKKKQETSSLLHSTSQGNHCIAPSVLI